MVTKARLGRRWSLTFDSLSRMSTQARQIAGTGNRRDCQERLTGEGGVRGCTCNRTHKVRFPASTSIVCVFFFFLRRSQCKLKHDRRFVCCCGNSWRHGVRLLCLGEANTSQSLAVRVPKSVQPRWNNPWLWPGFGREPQTPIRGWKDRPEAGQVVEGSRHDPRHRPEFES